MEPKTIRSEDAEQIEAAETALASDDADCPIQRALDEQNESIYPGHDCWQ